MRAHITATSVFVIAHAHRLVYVHVERNSPNFVFLKYCLKFTSW